MLLREAEELKLPEEKIENIKGSLELTVFYFIALIAFSEFSSFSISALHIG